MSVEVVIVVYQLLSAVKLTDPLFQLIFLASHPGVTGPEADQWSKTLKTVPLEIQKCAEILP